MFGFLVGSGFYDQDSFTLEVVKTDFGEAQVLRGHIEGKEAVILPRHAENHKYLPHHIPFKAHIKALDQLGCNKIVSFSVCGALKEDLPLAQPCVVTDLHYSDNRLPDGSVCSFFEKPGEAGRGHLIAESFFNSQLNQQIKKIHPDIPEVSYIYTVGPRFNSKAEIKHFHYQGGEVISQTCGPETILANELEIPYAMVVFPIDYANRTKEENTSMEELAENMGKSKGIFMSIIEKLVKDEKEVSFEGFVYRFE